MVIWGNQKLFFEATVLAWSANEYHLPILVAQVPQCFYNLVIVKLLCHSQVASHLEVSAVSLEELPLISKDFELVPESPSFTRKIFNPFQLSPFIKSLMFYAISSKCIWMFFGL